MKLYNLFTCFLALLVATGVALGQETTLDTPEVPAPPQTETADDFQAENVQEDSRFEAEARAESSNESTLRTQEDGRFEAEAQAEASNENTLRRQDGRFEAEARTESSSDRVLRNQTDRRFEADARAETWTDGNRRNQDRRFESEARTGSQLGASVDARTDVYRGSDRAALGVQVADSRDGIRIQSVYSDSPAARAGLRAGDRITTVNGRRYSAANDLTNAIRQMRVRDELTFHVCRNGQLVELSAQLDDHNRVFGQVASRNQSQQPHTAYRMPIESRQGLDDMRAKVTKLEDELAELRQHVRNLRSRLDTGNNPVNSASIELESEASDVGRTDGAIELNQR